MYTYKKITMRCFISLSFIIVTTLFLALFSTLSSANELPLKKENISRIESPKGIQLFSALHSNEKKLTLLYEHFDSYDMKMAKLKYTELSITKNDISFTKSRIALTDDKTPVLLRSRVSTVTINNVEWVYFIESETTLSKPALFYRAQWKNNHLVNKQLISLSSPIAGTSDPKLYKLDNEKIALVYRSKPYAGCCQLLLSMSDDGINFNSLLNIGNSGAMPALAQFSSQELLYTYQTKFVNKDENPNTEIKNGMRMRTHFRLSSNMGENWSKPEPITTRVAEVHDASAIQRDDGKIDVYYSSIDNKENAAFSLWRRCVSATGKLGREELVVNKAFGNIAKPSLNRLDNDSILLTFVEQGDAYSLGDHNLHAAIISSDSQCNI